jgi:hypothetical protein
MLGRKRAPVTVRQLLCTCVGVLALLLALGTATAGADPLSWASGASIVAPANVNSANPDIQINAVACPVAGECTAVGSYIDQAGSSQGLLVTETGGSWQPGIEASLPNSPNAAPQVNLTAVSCPSDGNCTAVGDYVDVHGWTEGVILTEAGGSWTKSNEVSDPGGVSVAGTPDVLLTSVSCPATGNCMVVGTYVNSRGHFQGLLEFQRYGNWSGISQRSDLPANAAAEIPPAGQPSLVVALSSVSCAAGEQCVAAGTYIDSSGRQQGLLVTGNEAAVGSPWMFSATEATLPAGARANPQVTLPSISCPSLGECDAVGSYTDTANASQGLLLTDTGDSWQPGMPAQLPADAAARPGASLSSVSCASAGNCDAVGSYNDPSSEIQGLLLTETSGSWGQGVAPTLPADASSFTEAALSSVSCSAPSNCAAAGTYSDGSFSPSPLLLSQSPDGSWSSPGTEPPLPSVSVAANVIGESVSCAPQGDCAGIADYTDAAGHALAAAVNGTPDAPATPTVSLTPLPATVTPGTPVALSASLSGGTGETGTVMFGVFGPQSTPPASCAFGATTVGSATVSGDDGYAPASDFTPTVAGDYWWYASYGGDLGDSPAASACGSSMAETVVGLPTVQTGTTTSTTTTSTSTSPSTATTPLPPVKVKPTPTPKPTVKLIAVKVSGSAVRVTVTCHAAAGHRCSGSLSLIATETRRSGAKPAKRSVLIGSARCKLAGGARRQLSVRLNRTGRSLLSARHRLPAQLRVTIGPQTVTRAVTFTRVAR